MTLPCLSFLPCAELVRDFVLLHVIALRKVATTFNLNTARVEMLFIVYIMKIL